MPRTRLATLFNSIPDRRNRKGLRYPLGGLLQVSLAAVMCGVNSLAALHRFGGRLSPVQCQALGFVHGRAPCHSGWHEIMKTIDPEALSQLLARFALIGEDGPGHIALDGKILRGSAGAGQGALHALYGFSVRLNAVVTSRQVAPFANEITAALALLSETEIEGTIITGDAIFTQREICETIISGGADYFFRVKLNQPDLHDDLRIALSHDPFFAAPDIQRHSSLDADHGRIEKRDIEVSCEAVPYLDWPGVAQIAKLTRLREINGKTSEEIAYLITSLPPESHGPDKLLALARNHWAVENRLFCIRDVTWREDQCRIRNAQSALTMANLRNIALYLFKADNRKNIQAAIEDCAANAKIALKAAGKGYF